jgi:hypothetical protein
MRIEGLQEIAISWMPILGAGELKLCLLVKRKNTIGNKYFLVKWGCILCVVSVLFFFFSNITIWRILLDSIQSLEKPVVVILIWVTFNDKKAVRFKIILNKLNCNYWAFGLSYLRTIGPSDYWAFGLSGLRIVGPTPCIWLFF